MRRTRVSGDFQVRRIRFTPTGRVLDGAALVETALDTPPLRQ